jgi:hypothetical protein
MRYDWFSLQGRLQHVLKVQESAQEPTGTQCTLEEHFSGKAKESLYRHFGAEYVASLLV